jgi:hypothetical protein
MSVFRFEIAQDAVMTLTNAAIAARKQNDKFQSVVESHGLSGEIEGSEEPNEAKTEEPMDIQEARADVTSAFVDISEAITGDGVPIRIDGKHGFEGNSYAAVLDRTQLRVPTERAFYKPRKYTIFVGLKNRSQKVVSGILLILHVLPTPLPVKILGSMNSLR